MKKPCLATVLVSALLIGLLSGCGAPAPEETASPAHTSQPTPTPVPAATPVPTAEPTPTSPRNGEEELEPAEREARRQAMLPVLKAAVRGVYENGLVYHSREPGYFWVALSYALNEEPYSALAQVEEWSLTVPRPAVEAYAAALFAAYDGLPEIPALLENSVWYDAAQDAYGVTLLSPWEAELALTEWEAGESGGYTALLSLEEAGVRTAYRVDLADASPAAADGQTPFYYAIVALRPAEE